MTTKIRIEWVRLNALNGDGGASVNQPGVEFGAQELTTNGSVPVQTQAAPYFGLLNGQHITTGFARVSAIFGAAIVAAGPSPMPGETSGTRITPDGEPVELAVNSGDFVAMIEAADAPDGSNGDTSNVADAVAEDALTAIHDDADQLVGASIQAHNDAIAAHGDATQAHADAGAIAADLATGNSTTASAKSDLDSLVSGQAGAGSQAHTDAGVVESDITAAGGQAHTDAGTAHTDAGVIEGDITGAQAQAHSDAGTAHGDAVNIESDLTTGASAAHADAVIIGNDVNSGSSLAHSDAQTAHADVGSVEADIVAAETQAHTDAGTAHTDTGAIEGDITAASGQAHTDAQTAHGDAGTIEGDITSAGGQAHIDAGTAHSDAATIEGDITSGAAQAHADAASAHGDSTALKGDLDTLAARAPALGQALRAGSVPVTPPSDPDYRPATATISAVDTVSAASAGQGGVSLVTGAPSPNSSLTWALNGQSSASITAQEGAWNATINLEISADNGVTFAPASARVRGSALTVSQITGAGLFQLDVTGMTHLRARATAYFSGPVTLAMTASAAPGLTQLLNPVRLVDTMGNAATVKAANVTATAADTALVVTDFNNESAGGFIDMPVDATVYAAGRNFQAECTVAGNVKLTGVDGSTRVVPIQVGLNILAYQVTKWTFVGVNGAATATFCNLK